MAEDVVRVAMIQPGEEPRLVITQNDHRGIQRLVGGTYELAAHIEGGTLSLYCNAEGLRRQLPDNIRIPLRDGTMAVVVGPVVLSRIDGEGQTVSLCDDEANRILEQFRLGGPYRIS